MARMSKKNTNALTKYQHQIDLAQRWRKDEGYDDLWHRLNDLYRGKHFDTLKEEDQIAVNIAFATINVIYPAISLNHPKISVLANEPDNEDRALFAEAILNYWWKHYDFHLPFRAAAKDFLVFGHGWVKTGWKASTEEVELDEDEMRQEFFERVEEARAAAAADPEMAGAMPSVEEIADSLATTKTVMGEDRPFAERVSPFDIFVSPDATCMQDMRWIAQRIVRPLEEVRSDKRYKQSARLNVKGSATLDISLDRRERRKYSEDIQRVIIWEFYDLVEGTLSVWAEDSDEFLVAPVDIPYVIGHPFAFVGNYDVPGQFYPIGDLEMLEPLQLELNKTRSALMNARKAFGRKYLVRESALSQKAARALADSSDNVAVPIEDDRPFTDIIQAMPHANLNPELFNWSDIIEGDVQLVSGVSEYQRGTAPSVRRTATEAAMIQDATNARSADKLALIEGFVTDVARKLLQLAQQFLTGEHIARVVGRQGQVVWLPYTRDDIIGEYDFTVEAGSTQPTNDIQRRQDALALVEAVGPFVEMGIVDPISIAKHVLQEGFKIRNLEKFISSDAMEMLEMRKMQQAQQIAQADQQMAMQGAGADPGMGGDPTMQGGAGVAAPQMDPMELLMAQQGPEMMGAAA